jgi:multiple antibiotic resistance protein
MNLTNFFQSFVPLFVAVDAIGLLPMFMGLTDGMERRTRQRTIKQAVFTALLAAVGFIFLGKSVFLLMGITVQDFMVAGGILLFAIAATDLLRGDKIARRIENIAAVPLGIPLIVGPAVLTTGLMLLDIHGIAATVSAMVINIILAGAILLTADFWTRLLGSAGSQAASKVSSLLLAAIAVMMIRKGIIEIISTQYGH